MAWDDNIDDETPVVSFMNSNGHWQVVSDGPAAKCPTCGYPERHRIFTFAPDSEPVLTDDGCPSCETSRMPVSTDRSTT